MRGQFVVRVWDADDLIEAVFRNHRSISTKNPKPNYHQNEAGH